VGTTTWLMPWGDYKGKPLEEIPVSYLATLLAQKWIQDWPEVYKRISLMPSVTAYLQQHTADDSAEGFQNWDDYIRYRN